MNLSGLRNQLSFFTLITSSSWEGSQSVSDHSAGEGLFFGNPRDILENVSRAFYTANKDVFLRARSYRRVPSFVAREIFFERISQRGDESPTNEFSLPLYGIEHEGTLRFQREKREEKMKKEEEKK